MAANFAKLPELLQRPRLVDGWSLTPSRRKHPFLGVFLQEEQPRCAGPSGVSYFIQIWEAPGAKR